MWWLIWTIVPMAAVISIGAWIGTINVRLKTRRQIVDHARQGLEFQLKRRHELIDRLLEPIQRDGSFDLDASENVNFLARRARHANKLCEREHFEVAFAEALKDLLAAVDDSAELSISEAYARPRRELEEVETDLCNAERFYNDAVQQLNAMIEFVPNRIIALVFSVSPGDYFEIKSAIPSSQATVETLKESVVPAPKYLKKSVEPRAATPNSPLKK
jgi:LemA protein